MLLVPSTPGFYEGHYYHRCLATFHSIRPLAPTLSIASKHDLKRGKGETDGVVQLDPSQWKLIQNSLCYSAVIGSYFMTHEFSLALQYYDEARKLGVFPRFREGMMIAQIHLSSEEYKPVYEELKSKESQIAGIPMSEVCAMACEVMCRDRFLLNKSKLPQLRRAVRQVYWNWHYNRPFSPKFDPKSDAICGVCLLV